VEAPESIAALLVWFSEFRLSPGLRITSATKFIQEFASNIFFFQSLFSSDLQQPPKSLVDESQFFCLADFLEFATVCPLASLQKAILSLSQAVSP
jgi:hypothetical protein